MIAISQPFRMTVEAYLEWEPLQELRYEFVDGEVLAMTGGTLPHNDIAINLLTALRPQVRQNGCRINIADAKVSVTPTQYRYLGSTRNLKKRLAQHQRGEGARHTAKRLPVQLVYCEKHDRVEDAFNREKQVQGWSRKKKEALMVGDMNELRRLAECRNESRAG